MHLLADLGLLLDLVLEQLTGRDAFPSELVGDEVGVLLSKTAGRAHQEDALHYSQGWHRRVNLPGSTCSFSMM